MGREGKCLKGMIWDKTGQDEMGREEIRLEPKLLS